MPTYKSCRAGGSDLEMTRYKTQRPNAEYEYEVYKDGMKMGGPYYRESDAYDDYRRIKRRLEEEGGMGERYGEGTIRDALGL